MAYSEKLGLCNGCAQSRPFRRHHPNHVLHVILTVFSGGLWLPMWVLAAVYPGAYRCTTCGAKYVRTRRPWSLSFLAFALVAVALVTVGVVSIKRSRSSWRPAIVPPPAALQPALPDGPVNISAANLLKAFREAPTTAQARYAEAELVVSGPATIVPPAKPGGQTWLVFTGSKGEALAQCLLADADAAKFEAHIAERDAAPLTVRCRLLRYSPDGSLTLHQAELVR